MFHKETLSTIRTTPTPIGIGSPGTLGFGVGVCNDQDALTRLNLFPMVGYNNPSNDNYGNYIHTPTQSVMVYIPAFKYRIGDLPEGDLPTQKWGVNSVQIWAVDDPQCPENAVLHRAFIDGGKQVPGFFCDKYICSPSIDGKCAVSIKNTAPLSLYYSTTNYLPTTKSALSDIGCKGTLDDAITASRARGAGYQCMSIFQLGAIRLLILAHGQASKDTTYNGWYDETGIHNGPHGNTNNLTDYDHCESTWKSGVFDGGYPNKGLTGSCSNFAASTHNGQNCGIADLKGCVYQVVTGAITSSNDNITINNKTTYVLNTHVSISDLDSDAMYDIANHHPITRTVNNDGCYWNPIDQLFVNDTCGDDWEFNGFLPPSIATSAPTNLQSDYFENDYCYLRTTNSMFPSFGSSWRTGSDSTDGLWYVFLLSDRTVASSYFGFRACAY